MYSKLNEQPCADKPGYATETLKENAPMDALDGVGDNITSIDFHSSIHISCSCMRNFQKEKNCYKNSKGLNIRIKE